MLQLQLLLAWASLWAFARLLIGVLSPCVIKRCPDLTVELEWWRATVRYSAVDGWVSSLALPKPGCSPTRSCSNSYYLFEESLCAAESLDAGCPLA